MSVGCYAALLGSGIASGALSLRASSLLTRQEWWLQESQEQQERAGPSTGVFEGVIVLLAKAQSHSQTQSHCGRRQQRVWVQGGEPLWLLSANNVLHPPYPFSCHHGEVSMGPSLDWQHLPKSVRHGKS